jgi:glycosyltransferase involved in cell wall biosynthesis
VRVAILVLSVDEAERLRTCLPAAAGQGADEIVVVDNASTDATVEVAREFARIVDLPERRSYARR